MTYEEQKAMMSSARRSNGGDFGGIVKSVALGALFLLAAAVAGYDIVCVRKRCDVAVYNATRQANELREEMENCKRDFDNRQSRLGKKLAEMESGKTNAESRLNIAQKSLEEWKAKADTLASELHGAKTALDGAESKCAESQTEVAKCRAQIAALRQQLYRAQANTASVYMQGNTTYAPRNDQAMRKQKTCPKCEGRGVCDEDCNSCGGTGWVTVNRQVNSRGGYKLGGCYSNPTKSVGCRNCTKGVYAENRPGTGKKKVKCSRCNGTGKIRADD